jgi:hypothetical protein
VRLTVVQMHVQTLVHHAEGVRKLSSRLGQLTGSAMEARNEPGRVSTFDESDYLFGTGPLRMIVDSVDWSRPRLHDGETWYDVHGIEIAEDGRVIGPRWTTVKAAACRFTRPA